MRSLAPSLVLRSLARSFLCLPSFQPSNHPTHTQHPHARTHLSEHLGKGAKLLGFVGHGASNKNNDALSAIFVAPMLQRQVCDLHPICEAEEAGQLNVVDGSHDLAHVVGWRHEQFRVPSSQGHYPNSVFGVGVHFRIHCHIRCIGERFQTRWLLGRSEASVV